MKRISIYLCLISALLLLGAGEATPQQKVTTGDVSNPFVGTWVLNLAKSSNPLPLKSDIVKIEAQDNGLKFTHDWVTTGEISVHWEMSPKYDGKYYPIIGSSDMTALLRRINSNSYERLRKQYGNETHSRTVVISEDGMTSTHTLKGKTSEGQEYTYIFVYDKQED